MPSSEYNLTQLPKGTQTPLWGLVLCVMSLIFSPFIGFVIYGKVSEAGLFIGLLFSIIPLLGLAFLATSRWYAFKRLPPEILEEWKFGKVFIADGAPNIDSPVKFVNQNDWIEIMPEGVSLSRHSLLSMQGVSEAIAKLWVAEQLGQIFVAWSDIEEWIVDTDSEGPDYHQLKLRPSGHLRVRRFKPDMAAESNILDAVRSVGKLPVRLRCDIN